MIINMTGGGGGAALNFKVVPGLTQPGTASENTIWVNTDQKITSWVFSAIKPNVVSVVENAGTVLGAIEGRTFTKTNNGKAAVAFVFDGNYTGPMLVSTDPDACFFSTSGDYVSTNGTEGTVVYNGKTYYYSSGSWMAGDWTQRFAHSMSANSHADAALLIAECWESKMTSGTVWFLTGTSSQVEFDALKKNIIQIYPISAKQFVGDNFIDVGVKSYQNGMWNEWVKPWDGTLYKNGDEYVSVTGGWTGNGTKNADNLYLTGTAGSPIHFITVKKIDLTKFTKLTAVGAAESWVNNMSVMLGVANGVTTDPPAAVHFGATAGVKTVELDVTHFTGEYYIYFYAGLSQSCKGYVTEIKLS